LEPRFLLPALSAILLGVSGTSRDDVPETT